MNFTFDEMVDDPAVAPVKIPRASRTTGTNSDTIRPPYNYFGGKRKVAAEVWKRFGSVKGYVEPFFGGGAVLLGSPLGPLQYEIINDLNHFVSNFWRAVQTDPQAVAHYCDWPVNEADLHSRHTWLINKCNTDEWRTRMYNDPDFCDAQVAGWWCWGSNMWIGGGWCHKSGINSDAIAGTQIPKLARIGGTNSDAVIAGRHIPKLELRGTNSIAGRKIPALHQSNGINSDAVIAGTRIPRLARIGGTSSDAIAGTKMPKLELRGTNSIAGTQMPRLALGGTNSAAIAGRHLPKLELGGTNSAAIAGVNLENYFKVLHSRMRKVKVCCGDWSRVLTNSCTCSTNLYGIFLDPPYSGFENTYKVDPVAHKVLEWALANGNDKRFRIALCAQTEQDMPGWSCFSWKRGRGMALAEDSKRDREKELVYFSPHCDSMSTTIV